MPSAKFVADFSGFVAAVNSAETKLRSFESGSVGVEKALARIGDSFSGRKILAEATLAAKAVEDIGGISKLTASEQARLNATVTEAVAKYKALGQTAPQSMLNLEQATRKVVPQVDAINAKMVALGTAIGSFLGNIAYDAVTRLGRSMVALVSEGAQTVAVSRSFDRLTESIGQTAEAMLSATRTATKGLITDLDIMQASNKAMLLGLPVTAKEMGTLSAAAVTLGKAMGLDAGQALNDLITALGRSSPMILDNLGLTVKVGEANERYALTLGKTASQLTDAEKKTAFYVAAMAAAEAKVSALGGVQLTMADQATRVGVAFQNNAHAIGAFLDTAAKPFAAVMSLIPDSLLAVVIGLGTLTAALIVGKAAVLGYTAAMAGGGAIASTFAIGAAAASGALATLGAAAAFFLTPVGLAVVATAALAAGFVYLQKATDTTIGPVRDLGINFDQLETSVVDANQALVIVGGDGLPMVIDGASQAAEAVKRLADELAENARQATANDAAVKKMFNPAPIALMTHSTLELQRAEAALTETARKASAEHERFAKIQDTLFGRDLLTRARDLSTALGGLPNITRLTVDKQRDLNKAVTDALAVYRALGQTAPPILQAIADATALAGATTMTMAIAFRAAAPAVQSTMTELDHMIPILSGVEELIEKIPALPFGSWPPMVENAAGSLRTLKEILADTIGDNLTRTLEGIPDLFVKAFTGGGGLLGALKALGVQLADAIIAPIMDGLTKVQQRAVSVGAGIATALGGAIGGGLGASVAGLATTIATATGVTTALAGAMTAAGVAGTIAMGAATLGIGAAAVGVVMLIKHFTGLSDVVKQARKATDEFTASLGQTLTQVQGLEVKQLMAAGASQKWAVQTVAIRDAYVLAGLSIDAANAAVTRLHAAEQKGGQALATVLNEIADVLKMAEEAQKLAAAAEVAAKEFETLVASFDGSKIFHDAELAVRAVEHLGGASKLTASEQARLNSQLKEAIDKYRALGIEAPSVMVALELATRDAVKESEKLVAAADKAFEAWAKTYKYISAGGSNVDASKHALSPENYATKADWEKAYLQDNANARPGQIESAWMSNSVVPDWAKNIPQFAGGSGGFVNFGSGTLAMLHGREKVVSEGADGGAQIINIYLDGRVIASGVARYLPGELAIYGVR